MYIIGITPGAYTLGRGAGTEIARELSGIAEKITFGYTVGCNFFQIDEEAFGEFLDPLFLDKLIALIEKMNIEWALHGFVLTGFYETLDYLTNPEWKTANLILHRDLTFLYEILLKLKKRNAPAKAFPHYTVYHASREYIVGYGIVRERGKVEVNAVNPFGERSWISILERKEREELLEWFKESILPILFERSRTFLKESFFDILFTSFLSSYLLRGIEVDRENLRNLLKFLSDFLDVLKDLKERINEKIDEIVEEVKKEIDEKLKTERPDIASLLFTSLLFEILEKKIKEKCKIEKDLNLYYSFQSESRKKWRSFCESIKKYEKARDTLKKILNKLYEEWKGFTTQREVRGFIPYEDVIISIISKDVELSNKKEKYKGILNEKNEWDSKEVYKFLFEVFIKKIKITRNGRLEKKEVNSVEEHVKEIVGVEMFDYETFLIHLTPQLNALTSVFYWICNFIVEPPIEHKDEVIKRAQYYEDDIKNAIIKFSSKNAFEKLKILNEELEKMGIKRKTKFFIGLETPEGESPLEGLRRICHLRDVFALTEALNIAFRNFCRVSNNAFEIVIDTEHLLSHAFDPKAEIEETIEFCKEMGRVYSRVAVYHIGTPKPYGGTTHLPFDIGSDVQFLIYEYCYLLRNLGFRKDNESYLIFERGGGTLPYEFLKTVILSLRKIAEYLEKEIDPKEIREHPENYIDFFGLSYEMIGRWYEIIKQHAYDPLKGLIVAPEETHTYLGKEAIEKYRKRPEEWASEELK
jgi:hypothetical protein